MKPNKTIEILDFLKDSFIYKYTVKNNEIVCNDILLFKDIWERELKKCLTPIEKIMGGILLNIEEIDFTPQFQVGKYRVDFFVSAISANASKDFIIECDGHDFHEKTKEQAKHDKERDRFFQSLGYSVYRFTGSEIYNNPLSAMFEIRDIAKKYLDEIKKEENIYE